MKSKIRIIIGVLMVFFVAMVWMLLRAETDYCEYDSPDGRYHVIVKKSFIHSMLPAAPGDSGGAPGSVNILEKATGKSIGCANIGAAYLGRDIVWEANTASIVPEVTWDLKMKTVVERPN